MQSYTIFLKPKTVAATAASHEGVNGCTPQQSPGSPMQAVQKRRWPRQRRQQTMSQTAGLLFGCF